MGGGTGVRERGREGEIVGGRKKDYEECYNCLSSTGEDYVWGSSRDGYKCTGMFALAPASRPMNLIDNLYQRALNTSTLIPFEEGTQQ